MLSQQIRRKFLQYFKEKGHALLPSSSVVPHEDPTLLFTNAGMNQFKDVFLGKSVRDYKRATTSQKCIRVGGKHNDLDNVGHTARHLTFFEMLGNFSFGDYFKKEAIAFAWEVTESVFEFDPAKVWITIFREDDESFELWKTWVPENRIVRMDEKDNFWAMGDTGPCGPCSELYYDKGAAYGSAKNPREDLAGTRYLEFWNLVFMQFNKDASGKQHPLPKQSIDTGAGLERIASLKLNIDNVFGTDILRSLIAEVEHISHQAYHKDNSPAYHVIADHIRSLSFAIADGAQPSNVERGYILRKLVRRAVRYGRMLGLHEPFLEKLLPRLISTMGDDYPELVASKNRIGELLTLEEESFLRTLKRGGNLLSSIIDKTQKSPEKQISGEDAFKLKDTYGLPLEEILLIAKDYHIEVNLDAYMLLEKQAKVRSKSAHNTTSQEAEENLFAGKETSLFVGYTTLECEGKVSALVHNSHFVQTLHEGQEGMVTLDRTSFYAEKGGQIGDTGVLENAHTRFVVTGCHTPYPGIFVHVGTVEKGTLSVGALLNARVDAQKRQGIENHHSATHLLHFALQQILGPHIKQAGSLVEEKRLRFDFNHHKALSQEEIRTIEKLVNAKIRLGTPVKTYEISYEEAQKRPQIKQFFGDKYGSTVRVVDIDYAQELCGGTHAPHVGRIGLLRITKESSVAAGVRRIEAVTGEEAEGWIYSQEDLLENLSTLLKTPTPKVGEKLQSLLQENKHLSQEVRQFKKQELKTLVEELLSKIQTVKGIPFLSGVVALEPELLQELISLLENRFKSGVLLIASSSGERCQLVAKVSSDYVQKGIQAVQLIRAIAGAIEGSGGGKAEMAQAGGKRPAGLQEAIAQAVEWLKTTS